MGYGVSLLMTLNMYLLAGKVKLRKDFNKCVDTVSDLGTVCLGLHRFHTLFCDVVDCNRLIENQIC